jgi:hypothetical protein
MSNRGSLNGDDSVSSSSSIPNLEEKLVLDENAPRARLCHLKKWPHFQGYGFNLHAERSRIGQHIGKVDQNSPAESAGLKEGDRIIEVNFVNISNENHQQVVKRIRTGLEIDGDMHEDEVVLLVVDSEADEYYKKLNIVVKHDFSNVLRLATSANPKEEESNQIAVENIQNKEETEQQQQKIEEQRRLVKNESPKHSRLDRNDLENRSTSSTNYYETNSLSDASDTNNNSKPKEKQLSNSKQITNSSPENSETDSNNNNLINEKPTLMTSSFDKPHHVQQQSQSSPSNNSNKLNSSPSSLSSTSKDSSNVSSNQNKISTNKKSPPELKDDPFSKFHFDFVRF